MKGEIKIKRILSIVIRITVITIIIMVYLLCLKTSNVLENLENKVERINAEPENLTVEVEQTQKAVNEETNEERIATIDNKIEEIKQQEEQFIGEIIIPKINLIAKVKEGVENKTINQYVGHFEDTSKWDGNIGLAAHNRGSNIQSYFSNIKNLQRNDVIIYKTGELQRQYLVQTITIIKETNWDYLQPTEDNRITLITCVNNQPQYRLCVQAIEE